MKRSRPQWLNKKIDYRAMHETEARLRGLDLHTVCHQARCPNIAECFSRGTATFLILGDVCTRGCSFCAVKHGAPGPPDTTEPGRVAEAVKRMGIRHAVVTSVTRDDLADGGASVFAGVIRELRLLDPPVAVEVLVPDFKGEKEAIDAVTIAGPDIFGHNIETVPSLYAVRKGCDYKRSLTVLEVARASSPALRTKSGLMLGLGETADEVIAVLRDLRSVGCDYLSLGQYLRPGKENTPVREYVEPGLFDHYKEEAGALGFLHVESGPYVRSSYMAERYTPQTPRRGASKS
ncbi:MAG: lipoyl synthase [Spirochaetes bacterium]|nr:lipoyl synthase [Spirochaetota bacterium]